MINHRVGTEKADGSSKTIKDHINKTIEASCTSKIDMRIIKSINAGTEQVTSLTSKLKELNKTNYSNQTKREA